MSRPFKLCSTSNARSGGTFLYSLGCLACLFLIPSNFVIAQEGVEQARSHDENRASLEATITEAENLSKQRTGESFKKAIEKYAKALAIIKTTGDSAKEAEVTHNIGELHYYLGQIPKALEHYERALSLRRSASDRQGESTTLNNIGAAYYSLGEYAKTLEYYNQALELQRVLQDKHGEASTLSNIGVLYNSMGEKQKALDYYNKSLPLRRLVGDRKGEGTTLHNIGRVFDELGEKQKALDYYNDALLISRTLGDRRGEAGTLHNIGIVYYDLGEREKAFEYFNQALELFRTVGDRYGEAYTLSHIGLFYRDSGDPQKALDYYNQALQLRRTVGDRRGEAATLHNIGGVYSNLGEHQKALEYYKQAIPLWQALGNRGTEAVTLYNIGGVYYDLGEKQRALDAFVQALPMVQAVGDRRSEANILAAMARVERDFGQLAEARSHIEAAIAIVQSLRTKVASPELRASYFATVKGRYEFYIDLLMRQHVLDPSGNCHAAALEASEAGRGRSLLETLTEARADIRQGADSLLLERNRSLQQKLNAKAERLTRVLSAKHTEEQAAAAKRELDAALAEYQEVEAQIRTTSPRYAALVQPQPLSVREIQQLLDEDTILLEYALGEERSYLWVITPTTLSSFTLPKRVEIDSLARRTYELLTSRNQRLDNETSRAKRSRVMQADVDYHEAAAALSQMVLGPAVDHLGTKRLLVVSEGALQFIPFGALPAQKAKSDLDKRKPAWIREPFRPSQTSYPLALDHEIISLPSASVLAVMRRELALRKPADRMLAVLADPVFASDDPRVKRGGRMREEEKISAPQGEAGNGRDGEADFGRALRDFTLADTNGLHIPRLVFSRQEAQGILSRAPDELSMQSLDFAASRDLALSPELSRYRIVHFATHGLLNSVHPELSGIALSLVNERGERQDGFVRLHEIYNLRLPADLVVLSACQTALGKEINGEGLVGLTRGFMYAGAACVVASLWNVDDEATAELMKRFYDGMLGPEKLRPAAALRAAQASMWKEKRWQSPYYWAAFVLQGEWK